jgi:hypothetical protein
MQKWKDLIHKILQNVNKHTRIAVEEEVLLVRCSQDHLSQHLASEECFIARNKCSVSDLQHHLQLVHVAFRSTELSWDLLTLYLM